jgi:hypothetical protein
VAALAGDREAALDTRLVLPETGVCDGPGLEESVGCALPALEVAAAGCCAPLKAKETRPGPTQKAAADIAVAG